MARWLLFTFYYSLLLPRCRSRAGSRTSVLSTARTNKNKFTASSIRFRQRRSKELRHMVQAPFISAIYLHHLIITRRVRKIDWSKEIRHSTVNTFQRLIIERTLSNSTPRRVNESTTANGWNWRRLLYQFCCAARGHGRWKRSGCGCWPATKSTLNYKMHSRFKSTKCSYDSQSLAN